MDAARGRGRHPAVPGRADPHPHRRRSEDLPQRDGVRPVPEHHQPGAVLPDGDALVDPEAAAGRVPRDVPSRLHHRRHTARLGAAARARAGHGVEPAQHREAAGAGEHAHHHLLDRAPDADQSAR